MRISPSGPFCIRFSSTITSTHGTGGKPPFTLWEEDGKYRVTVMHRNHKGDSEAETYHVRETEGVLFIETGFAVMMDYDREKDRIRLSPGGEYRRKSAGPLKQ